MSKLMLATASAAILAAAPAAAQSWDNQNQSMPDRAKWFQIADRNDNDMLSRSEFRDLSLGTVDREWVAEYRGDMRNERMPVIARDFAQLDRNSNGMLSLTEFTNAGRYDTDYRTVSMTQPTGADDRNTAHNSAMMSDDAWAPEFLTVTYYLSATPIDTDSLYGRDVVNLKGEHVGTIDRIIRTEDENRYYAMLNIDGAAIYKLTSGERDHAGVPLDDLLLGRGDDSLLLSTRGEQYLENASAREIEQYEAVDRLYGY